MSRLVKKPIQMATNQKGQPLRIKYQERWSRVVKVLDRWYDTGCWWEGESCKLFYRVQLEENQVLEVFAEPGGQLWWLYKIYD